MDEWEAFAPGYDEWSADMTEDVDFYVGLAREADGPVVELAVGTGRVAIPIARTGKRVVGIDSSPAMLAVARRSAEAAGVTLDLREGDMRSLVLDEPTDLVICPYRSLLHLPTWHARRDLFERVAGALRPGGRFAWNVYVFDHEVAAEIDGRWREEPVRHRIEHVPADTRVDFTTEDGRRISSWWVARSEWEGLIDVSGLQIEALYGWFDRRPFDEDSREFVWIARKPLSRAPDAARDARGAGLCPAGAASVRGAR